MGFTKIVQYGDLQEIYSYDKFTTKKKRGTFTKRQSRIAYSTSYMRSRASLQRAKTAFIRAVYAQLQDQGKPVFITLTNYKDISLQVGYEYLRLFIFRLRKRYPNLSFYAVPEWTKLGRLHFHLLAWGIPEQEAKKERDTRFFQRNWNAGFVDVRLAKDSSPFIALYMAKYLIKGLSNPNLANQRAYTHSRNVQKVRSYGSNTLSTYLSTILSFDREELARYHYSTPYLGECEFKKLKINYDPKNETTVR